jgi:hypothetical protein
MDTSTQLPYGFQDLYERLCSTELEGQHCVLVFVAHRRSRDRDVAFEQVWITRSIAKVQRGPMSAR